MCLCAPSFNSPFIACYLNLSELLLLDRSRHTDRMDVQQTGGNSMAIIELIMTHGIDYLQPQFPLKDEPSKLSDEILENISFLSIHSFQFFFSTRDCPTSLSQIAYKLITIINSSISWLPSPTVPQKAFPDSLMRNRYFVAVLRTMGHNQAALITKTTLRQRTLTVQCPRCKYYCTKIFSYHNLHFSESLKHPIFNESHFKSIDYKSGYSSFETTTSIIPGTTMSHSTIVGLMWIPTFLNH